MVWETPQGRDRGTPTSTDDDFYLHQWPTIWLLVHWEIKKLAHLYDCHFTVTQIRTGMPQKQLPVRPEKKKKESKGEIQISHREVPRLPAEAAVLKLRECVVLSQSPLLSALGPLCIFTLISFVLPSSPSLWRRGQAPSGSPLPQFSSSLHPNREDGRGPTPGWECGKCTRAKTPEGQAIAGGSRDPGAGATPVFHLHLPALLCFPGKTEALRAPSPSLPASSCWGSSSKLQDLGNNLVPKLVIAPQPAPQGL